MTVERRPASSGDREFARRLHHAAYRDVVTRQFGGWNEAVQDKFFDESWNPNEAQIVQEEGRDIGLIQRRLHQAYIELVELQILPEYQGRGIGTRLLNDEIAAAANAGLPIKLRVLKENYAQHLYRRHGFSEVGTTEIHLLMERRE